MRLQPTILVATLVALALALAPAAARATTAFASITEQDPDGVWVCGERLEYFTQFSTSDETEPLEDVRFFYQLPPFLQLEANSLTTTLPNTTVVSGGGGQDTFVDVRWSPHNLGSVQTIRYRARVSCCPPVFSPPIYQSGRFLWLVESVEVEAWPSITAQQPPVAPGAPSVVKDDGGITATPGSAITYVVVPTQSGTAELADVVLTETVPADTRFSPAGSAPWSCAGTAAGATCTLTIAALTCDASTGYPFRVVVDAAGEITPGRTEITNQVDLASSAGAATGTDTTPLFISAPDLAVGLGDGGALATAGGTVIYDVTAANDGNVDLAAGATLAVALDPRTSFTATGSSTGWSCGGETCTRTLPAMAVGSAPRVFQLAVTVASPLPAGVPQLAATATGTLAGDVDPSNDSDSETTPIDASTTGPDLGVDLDDGGALATAGAPYVYTVSVANAGNQHLASGASLSVELDPETSFRAAGSSGGWSCSAGSCSRTLPAMNAGAAPRVFQLAVNVASPIAAGTTELDATATVAAAGDLDPANDTDAETTPIDASTTGPDLAVGLDDGGIGATAGGTFAYTVAVGNEGNQHLAAGAGLTVDLDPSTTFVAAGSSAGWTCVSGTCTRVLPAMSAGASPVAFDLAVTVVSPLAAGVGELVATATVAAAGDLDASNDTDAESTPIDTSTTGPDLAVDLDDGGVLATAGGTYIYAVAVRNVGNQDLAIGEELGVALDAATVFSPAGSTAGWSCAGGICTRALPALGAGDAATTIDLEVTVASPLAVGVTELTAIASVAVAGDLDAANDSDSETTPIDTSTTGPDLAVDLDDGGVLATAVGSYVYTVSVTNAGNQHLGAEAELAVDLDAATTFATGGSSPGWSCTGGLCTRTLPPLAAGAAAETFDLEVTVASPLPAGVAELVATATVTTPGDLDPANDTDTETTPVDTSTTGPDLTVDLGDGGVLATAGQSFVYSVAVTNEGNQDLAPGADLTVELDSHTAFSAVGSSTGWSCTATTCTRSLPALAAGASPLLLALEVTVASPLPAGVDELVASATVAAAGDLDPTNDTDAETTPLDTATAGPDLAVTLGDGGVLATPGDSFTYSVSVVNAGNQDVAAGAELTVELDALTAFSAAGSSTGWTCVGESCTRALPAIAAGASALVFDLEVAVDASLPAGTAALVAEAIVTAAGDLDPTNDRDTESTPLDGQSTGPDVAVTLDDGGAQATPGEPFTYVVSVANEGNQDLVAGAELAVELDALTSMAESGSTSGWSCADGTCTRALAALAAGSVPVAFELEVLVADPVPEGTTALSATATATAEGDIDPTNDSDTESTPVVVPSSPPTNVALTLSGSRRDDADGTADPKIRVGRLVVATVTNTTAIPAPDVSLRIELAGVPEMVTPRTEGTFWACDGLACFYAVGEVGPGAEVSVELPFSQGAGRVDVYGLVSTPAEEVTLQDNDDAIVFEDGGVVHEVPTLGTLGSGLLLAVIAYAAHRRLRVSRGV